MFVENKIWMAKNDERQYLLPEMANRHGLICGATGTGKTITLKVMAEAFSDAGVPVFVSDIKGDLSGMSVPGVDSESMQKRIARFGLAEAGWEYKAYPTRYWDVFGEKGTPIRATVSEMGPLLLSRILDLNDTQEGILNIIFRIADDQNLLLLDLKDLQSMVRFVGDNAAAYKTTYGNIAAASIGAIQRAILRLEEQGGDTFFGEPALDIKDWMQCDADGRGFINDMNCEKLFQQPQLYSTFLLWMLSEIYNTMPEIGDPEKPKFVFFFDEAHLLFNDAPKQLLQKVEQVVRLIRSKGVGVYFITQTPSDIPDTVLAQLGNRIEHALRAYSPAELKAIKAAAQTFRQNPAFDTVQAIQECGTGEALVQFLDEKGAPRIVERAFILPPQSQMGVADEAHMMHMIATGDMGLKYNQAIDRESAYELLGGKMSAAPTVNTAEPAYDNAAYASASTVPYAANAPYGQTPQAWQPVQSQPMYDPMTGQPIAQPAQPAYQFDPMTGQPIAQAAPKPQYDPMTGQPIAQPAQPAYQFDPMTGQLLAQAAPKPQYDPMTGQPIAQTVQQPAYSYDPMTGQPIVTAGYTNTQANPYAQPVMPTTPTGAYAPQTPIPAGTTLQQQIQAASYEAAWNSYLQSHSLATAQSAGVAAGQLIAERWTADQQAAQAAYQAAHPNAPILTAPGTAAAGVDPKEVKALATEAARNAVNAAKEAEKAQKEKDKQAEAERKAKEKQAEAERKAKEKEDERRKREREKAVQSVVTSGAKSVLNYGIRNLLGGKKR